MNTKNLILSFLLVFAVAGLKSQDKKKLLSDFTGTDWSLVKEAKSNLENLQGDVIGDLILLLDNSQKVKLQKTGSLIYPGAEKFYGYGQIIDYDIDYIAIRAGWLLEDLTFNNFGFSGIHLPSDDIVPFIKETYPSYYNIPANRKKVESASAEELRSIVQQLAIKAAKDWWTQSNKVFNRLSALDDALKSSDEKRQWKALFYMRNGTSRCTGLTKDVYYDEISREIVRLSGSDVQRISENAKLILLDTKLEWLNLKQMQSN